VFVAGALGVRAHSQGQCSAGYTLPTRVAGDLLVAFVNVPSGLPGVGFGWVSRAVSSGAPSGVVTRCLTRTATGTDAAPSTATTGDYVIYAVKGWTGWDAPGAVGSSAAGTTLQTASYTVSAFSVMLNAYGGAGVFGTTTEPPGWAFLYQISATPNLATAAKFVGAGTYSSFDLHVTNSQAWDTITIAIH